MKLTWRGLIKTTTALVLPTKSEKVWKDFLLRDFWIPFVNFIRMSQTITHGGRTELLRENEMLGGELIIFAFRLL